ncbi:hypothetical protein [Amycolatopsis thermophila]|uniref:Uncharacterized protein n=1 Tax=Amycolatopsis thermophila TaxID=206084 RepID=A0ABU0EMN0_9PSEU|nr:hypothetical protein [Amycolatopsis thermophila]MDQ0376530.1 hypothetical protein [Amycolatopsis thermophila]
MDTAALTAYGNTAEHRNKPFTEYTPADWDAYNLWAARELARRANDHEARGTVHHPTGTRKWREAAAWHESQVGKNTGPAPAGIAAVPRRIGDDCLLTYFVQQEAWFADAAYAGEVPAINISASADTGRDGVKWDFTVQEHHLAGRPALQVSLFDDAFAAFTDVPELFAALAAEQPRTLDQLRNLLDRLGAVDVTRRTRD